MNKAKPGISWLIGRVLLCAYMGVIHLCPRLSNGFRVEDFLMPIMAIALVALLDRDVAPILLIPVAYFAWSLLITSLHVWNNHLPLQAFLIWGKEFQYFLGAAILLLLFWRRQEGVRPLQILITMLAAGAALFAIYSVVTLKAGYYGLGYFNEMDSPSLNAWTYFNLMVLMVIGGRYLGINRYLYRTIAIILFIAVILTGSRTGQMISGTFVVGCAFVYRPTTGLALAGVLLSLLSVLQHIQQELYEFLLGVHAPVANAFFRLTTLFTFVETLEGSRMASWHHTIDRWLEGNILFGCGRGCTNLLMPGVMHGLTMGGDNQYTRNLEEIGLIGSGIFSAMLVGLAFSVRPTHRGLYLTYLAAYLLGGVTMEAWQLSKPGQLFWIVTALMIVVSRRVQIHSGRAIRSEPLRSA